MNRCDVHVLTIGRSQKWFDQCLSSLDKEPVNIHVIKGTPGHIGLGRYKGFSSGTAEFVSFVDDDDYVDPGAFEHCYNILDENPNTVGVCTRERFLGDGFIVEQPKYNPNNIDEYISETCNDIKQAQHLVVMRRKLIEPFLYLYPSWNVWCERALYATLYKNGYKFAFSDKVFYNLRNHNRRTSNKVNPNKEVIRAMQSAGLYIQKLSPGTTLKKIS